MIRLQRTGILAVLAAIAFALAAVGILVPGGIARAQDDGGAQETSDAAQQEQADLLANERNTIDIIDTYGPSVVAITVRVEGRVTNPLEGIPEDQLPPFLREFLPQFEQRQGPQQGSGSGFVVDADGSIVTNYHVVQQALQESGTELREGAELTVTFPENGTHPARVVGVNALYDLALLELEDPADLPGGVTPIPLTENDPLVGQKAIAIGNPFGFESTVTTGIVSAIGRNLPGVGEVAVPLVQTDAAINPGNSGGPLLDSQGRLIGINTAIIPNIGAMGQRGSLGIGFAVPSSTLAGTLDELRAGGYISIETRPRLGLTYRDVRAYPPEVRSRLNLPDQGAGVLSVEPGGAAAEAGIQGSEFAIQVNGTTLEVPGDIIVAVNGEPLDTGDQLQQRIFALDEGDPVTLTILRDGEEMEVELELAVVPQQNQQSQQSQQDPNQDQEDEEQQEQQQ